MKIRSAQLKTVCGYTSTLPKPELPEAAFAGRSNVGKSSLINALMQRKRLARVGETPGKTRTINFYEIDALVKRPLRADSGQGADAASPAGSGQGVSAASPAGSGQDPDAASPADAGTVQTAEEAARLCLVDLPGYGYANVSLQEKARWGKMVENYLNDARDLRIVFLLIDIRHGPNANDRQMYEWIVHSGHTPVLIATKADKVKRSQVSRQLKLIREELKTPKGSVVIPFSAQTGSGREEICAQIAGILREQDGAE